MTYAPPLDLLLALGDVRQLAPQFDYINMGFSDAEIPELIRLATDTDMMGGEPEDPHIWGPVHAWRVLGLLRAEAAIPSLVNLFHELEGSYWTAAELPKVFAAIGPSALPALHDYLYDPDQLAFARARAVRGVEKMALTHDVVYEQSVSILKQQLEQYDDNPDTLNGFLVKSLANIEAVDVAPLIEEAYASGQVNQRAAGGNWDDIQVKLGLKEAPPRKQSIRQRNISIDSPAARHTAKKAQQKAKAKRKQAKKSRKRNRK